MDETDGTVDGGVDKVALLRVLLDRVAADLAALERRQHDEQAGSTHEESRAEHAKDTRATEQSYLARGLADRVAKLRRNAAALGSLELHEFGEDDPIAVTALVELSTDDGAGEAELWWLVPTAGGLELELGETTIRTITPTSPLGRSLLGLGAGDEGTFRTPRGERGFEVIRVS